MKKILIFIVLFFAIVVKGQVIDLSNNNLSLIPEYTNFTIGYTSINNGDSVLLASNCDGISYIDFILNTGTDYDGSGDDVTTLYTYLNGVKTQFAYIPESWILSSTEIKQRVFFTASHDLSSPIWIEFGSQFYNGTRDLDINYKKE